MKNYHLENKYIVVNQQLKPIFSSNVKKEADAKAKYYTKNGIQDFFVLERKSQYTTKREVVTA